MLREIAEYGLRSDRAKASFKRINAIHARAGAAIKNDDMKYTLWVFHYECVRWNVLYGWRTITSQELDVRYDFWREIGVGLKIVDLPTDRAEFEQWGLDYEVR